MVGRYGGAMVWLLRTLVLLTGLALGALAAAQPRDAEAHFFQASFGDLKEELGIARAEGKRGLFLMFHAEYCTPCIAMKKTVLSQVPVQEYYRRHFRVLQIDFNGDAEVADLDGRWMRSKDYAQKVARVRGTPTFMIIGADGAELVRHYGPTRDAREFMMLGEFVVQEQFRRQPFDAYWRERVAAVR
jgi:thioredoxin-related protein